MPIDNVDSHEIAKFERMAHRWWDPQGEFKPLHLMNPVRAHYIDLKASVAQKSLLDVGCGGGLLCEAMAQRGAQVTGLDLGEGPLQVAKMHAANQALSIDYIQISVETLAQQKPQSYDIVTCLEMLEHVPDPKSAVQACAQLIKPGGHVFFSTLNRNFKAYLMAVIGAEYLLKWLPKGTHEYQKFIRPSELANHCRDASLVVKDISGIIYNPLTQQFSINSQDVDVNYILHAQKNP
jgi:2-polyprenyl-6-hydroxyphenyl methylase / 3-demethylubiquinone-9 3-methyltransferase